MSEWLDYLQEHPLEAKIFWSFLRINDRSSLEEVRQAVLDFAEVAKEEDSLSQEILKQAAIKEMKELGFSQPSRLIDAAFKAAKTDD